MNPNAVASGLSRPLLLVLLSVGLLVGSTALAEGPSWVITVDQESVLRDALGGDRPITGAVLKSAAIDKATVTLSYVPVGGGAVTGLLTLVHPEAATGAATRLPHVAIEPKPGPAPTELVAGLAKRLEAASGLEHLWTRLAVKPEEPTPAEAPKEASGPDPKADEVAALGSAYARGDEALARSLAAKLDVAKIGDPAVRLEATLVLAKLGQSEAVLALSRTFIDSWANVGRSLRGELSDPDVLLKDKEPAAVCGHYDLAHALISGGHGEAGEALYRAILARAPTCHQAVIGLALQLLGSDRAQATIDLLLPWHERDQGDEQVNTALSSAYRHLGDLDSAIRHFHFTADKRAQDPDARFLGLLNALYLKANNEAYWAEHWRAVLDKQPEHYVGRFLLGACLHYLDEFEESNVHLDQLVGLLDHEPRLYVYRAMNRFNLGKAQEARALLEQAAKLPAVDPDVFYCLGEVTRDTDRDVAITNLDRYLTLTPRSSYSNPTKHARVTTMRDNLTACKRDGVAVCDGPWEHPRPVLTRALWRHKEIMDYTVLLVVVLAIGWWVRRRRKRAASA